MPQTIHSCMNSGCCELLQLCVLMYGSDSRVIVGSMFASAPNAESAGSGRWVAFSCSAYADRPLLRLHPGGPCRLGGLRRRGTPPAVLSPGQARRVAAGAPGDLTRLAGAWAVASRRSFGSQRLDPSALAATEVLVKHPPRAECLALSPSPDPDTPSRWFSSPSGVTGLVHRPMG